MRLVVATVLSLLMSSVVFSHDDGLKIEQRAGLKSEAVIKNEMRLLGLDVSQIIMNGANAEISAMVRGQPFRIKVDRISGVMQQIGGRLRLDPTLLNSGIIKLER